MIHHARQRAAAHVIPLLLLLPLLPARGTAQYATRARVAGTPFRLVFDTAAPHTLRHFRGWGYQDSSRAASIVQSPPRDDLGGESVVDPTVPVDDPRQALAYAPGVVLRRGDLGIDVTPEITIRGGAKGQAAAYVDGAPVRNLTFGDQQIFLGANVIEQMSVVPGLPAVSIGDVRGGVINYLTRSRGVAGFRGPHGNLRVETDEPFGDGSAVGYNRVEGSAGGQLKFVPNFNWFVAVGAQGQRSQYRGLGAAGQPAFVPNGVDTVVQGIAMPRFVQASGACDAGRNFGFDCTGLRRPLDWSTLAQAFGRITYSYGQGGSLSLTGIASGLQERQFPGFNVVNAALYSGSHSWSRLLAASWGQPLPALGGGALTVTANLSLGSDRTVGGLLDPLSEVVTRNPWLGMEFTPLTITGGEVIPNPITDQIIRNVRSQSGVRVPYRDRFDLDAAQFGRLNPFGMQSGWPTSGLRGSLELADERRVSGRGALEWRPGRLHRITVGMEVTHAEASFYTADLIRDVNLDAFVARPRSLGVFAGDHLTLGGGAWDIDVGVRYDRFRAGADFPITPGRIATHPAWNPAAATDDTAYANSLARTMVPGRSHTAVSPRLRIGYALPPRTRLRAAIGQTADLPPLLAMLSNSNSDFAFTNASAGFGRDVGYAKVWLYEVGATHAIGQAVHIDVAFYHKSDLTPFQYRIQPFEDPRSPTDTISINVLTRRNNTTGTGGDARIAWVGQAVQGAVTYSILGSRSTDPGAFVPFTTTVTTHAISAVGRARIPGVVDATLTARAVSGLPYSRLINDANGTIVPFEGFGPGGRLDGSLNGARLPWTKTIDLRLSREFRMGRFGGSVFADARNLLGLHNTVALFAETGAKINDDYRIQLLQSEFDGLTLEAQAAGALLPDGTTIDLQGNCAGWAAEFNCVSLRRVEARFGDGNGIYTLAEQQRVLNAFYDSFLGPWRFNGPGRTVRFGVTFAF